MASQEKRRACFLWYLIPFLAGLIYFTPPVFAGVFHVNSKSDSIDVNLGDGECANQEHLCTLRAAIQESNARAGADVVYLPAGQYWLTQTETLGDGSVNAYLSVTDDLRIIGDGEASTYIQGVTEHTHANNKHSAPLFSIALRPDNTKPIVSLNALSVSGGYAEVEGSVVHNRGALYLSDTHVHHGGDGSTAIHSVGGELSLNNSTFSENSAAVVMIGGKLRVRNSLFLNNKGADGAAIRSIEGAFTQLESTKFVDNAGLNKGGAITAEGGTLSIKDSVFYGNSISQSEPLKGVGGGAVYAESMQWLLVSTSTFTNNNANAQPHAQGGAIHVLQSPVFISGSHFKENTAYHSAGALYIAQSRSEISNTHFDHNVSNVQCGALDFRDNQQGSLELAQIGASTHSLIMESVTFRSNKAMEAGGAACLMGQATIRYSEFSANVAGTIGGGIAATDAAMVVENVTVAGNSASIGGGIYLSSNFLDRASLIRHVTLADNLSVAGSGHDIAVEKGRVDIGNSIVASHLVGDASDDVDEACLGELHSEGYNIAVDSSCHFNQTSDHTDQPLTLQKPVLMASKQSYINPVNNIHKALPTLGYSIEPDSLAYHRIPIAHCTHLDQLYGRRSGDYCDAGAIEWEAEGAYLGLIHFKQERYSAAENEGELGIRVHSFLWDDESLSVTVLDTHTGSSDPQDYQVNSITHINQNGLNSVNSTALVVDVPAPEFEQGEEVSNSALNIESVADVMLLDDADSEGVETVEFVLVSPLSGAIIVDPSTAQVEIVDNESSDASISFSMPVYTFSMEQETTSFSVQRTGHLQDSASVHFTITKSAAVNAGVSSESLDGFIHFDEGVSIASQLIDTHDANSDNVYSHMSVQLSALSHGYQLVHPMTATIEVAIDDDSGLNGGVSQGGFSTTTVDNPTTVVNTETTSDESLGLFGYIAMFMLSILFLVRRQLCFSNVRCLQ